MNEPTMSQEKIDPLCFWCDTLGPKYEAQYNRLLENTRSMRRTPVGDVDVLQAASADVAGAK